MQPFNSVMRQQLQRFPGPVLLNSPHSLDFVMHASMCFYAESLSFTPSVNMNAFILTISLCSATMTFTYGELSQVMSLVNPAFPCR